MYSLGAVYMPHAHTVSDMFSVNSVLALLLQGMPLISLSPWTVRFYRQTTTSTTKTLPLFFIRKPWEVLNEDPFKGPGVGKHFPSPSSTDHRRILMGSKFHAHHLPVIRMKHRTTLVSPPDVSYRKSCTCPGA